MRTIILLFAVLLLSGCKKAEPMQLQCGIVDLAAMTREQRAFATAYCDAAVKQVEQRTMASRLKHEADTIGMPLNEFVQTPVGMVALAKELAGVIIALVWVIGGWFTAALFVRLATWEEQSATRKKWGPFSIWEIQYSKRKSAFLDMTPTAWVAILGGLGFVVSGIVYATVTL